MTASENGNHDAPRPLLAYIDGLVETLRALVPLAIRENQEEAIHDARVSTRRLKAAIDLLQPALSEDHLKPFAKTLRKLRRRLGPLRDLDVMDGHLKELLARGATKHADAIAWLSFRLQVQREAARDEASGDAPATKVLAKLGQWWGLREEIAEACETDVTDGLIRDSLSRQLAEFSKEANRLADPDPSGPSRVDPHAIRIAGKSLRYTLEMAKVDGHPLSGDVTKTFKRLQDALGLWHDYVVLTERMLAMCSDEQLAHHDAAAQRRVLALAQATLQLAERYLAKFAELWKSRGSDVSQAIGTVFVPAAAAAAAAAAAVSVPQTGPDPSG
jgi:CHAD domain-containing protein